MNVRRRIAGTALGAAAAFFAMVGHLDAQIPSAVRPSADTDALSRAFNAERTGLTAEAAKQFSLVLQQHPANAAALMGLERALPRLDRRQELLPYIARALAVDSNAIGVMLVAVRTFAALGAGDSAAKYAKRWARQVPHDESPYREWSMAALEVRDIPQGLAALELGRSQLGGPPALGLELAQLLQQKGDVAAAAKEWVTVVHATPVYRDGAVSVLSQVPFAQRTVVHDVLLRDGSPDARQLLGLLDAQWGNVPDGVALVRNALPADPGRALALLTSLLVIMHNRQDSPSLIARATTLEAMAARESGGAVTRTLLDAARAYADAGDERNARRILDRVSADPAAPPGMTTKASTTLLGVLLAEGKPADAERVLAQLSPSLSPDDRDAAARRVAMAWVRIGDFTHAEQLVAGDSSTEGLDLRGRLQLYRGDLAGAAVLLNAAGPFDDDREEALRRVTLLSLLQAVGRGSSPALGTALLALERSDSARAVTGLEAVAAAWDSGGGAAEARLLAGRVALLRKDSVTALRLLRLADAPGNPATAAAARLDLARISAAGGHQDQARALLERLILDFPESAVVPEARRLRDMLRGTIPGGGQ